MNLNDVSMDPIDLQPFTEYIRFVGNIIFSGVSSSPSFEFIVIIWCGHWSFMLQSSRQIVKKSNFLL